MYIIAHKYVFQMQNPVFNAAFDVETGRAKVFGLKPGDPVKIVGTVAEE